MHVGPGVERPFAGCLFGTHVGGRPEIDAGRRQPRRFVLVGGSRNAEIRDQGVAVLEEDVLRLDVAVDDPMGMRVVEGVSDLAGGAHRVLDRQPTLTLEAITQ